MGISSKEQRKPSVIFYTSLCMAVCLFVLYSITYKLVTPREDWLFMSLSWSIYWSIGFFLGKVFRQLFDNLYEAIIIEVVIILVMSAIGAFTLGVLFNLSSWARILYNVVLPFAISILMNSFL